MTSPMNIKTGLLQRRFGHNFSGLETYCDGGDGKRRQYESCSTFFYSNRFTKMDVLVIRPVEIENLFKVISPEKDLVILSSWSGTTADIVQFANHLKTHNVPFVAVTEKLFSDLGLIAERSGGVLSTLSGEEITVSGIKSTLCMLFCLCLFTIWLCSRICGEKKALNFWNNFVKFPIFCHNCSKTKR
jgi:hypothetical protein